MTKICNWILEPRLCKIILHKYWEVLPWHRTAPCLHYYTHVSSLLARWRASCSRQSRWWPWDRTLSSEWSWGIWSAGSRTERPQLGWAPLLSPCTDTLTLILLSTFFLEHKYGLSRVYVCVSVLVIPLWTVTVAEWCHRARLLLL